MRNTGRRTGTPSALALLAWLGALVLVIVELGSLEGPSWRSPVEWAAWATARGTEGSALLVLRAVALGLSWYLLLTTTASLAARSVGAVRLVAALDPLTLSPVRKLVHAVAGAGVAGSVLVAAAGPTAWPLTAAVAAVQEQADQPPPTIRRLPDDGAPAPAPTPAPSPAPPPPTLRHRSSWVIAPGDHLWSVAERVVARAWGRAPSDQEVAPYWRLLVETNRPSLADPANPDLVFPGQALRLPSPPAPPG
jgi:hypothetical protein